MKENIFKRRGKKQKVVKKVRKGETGLEDGVF